MCVPDFMAIHPDASSGNHECLLKNVESVPLSGRRVKTLTCCQLTTEVYWINPLGTLNVWAKLKGNQ